MRGCNVSAPPSCNPWFVQLCLQQPARYQPLCSWVLLGADTFRYLKPGRYQPLCSGVPLGMVSIARKISATLFLGTSRYRYFWAPIYRKISTTLLLVTSWYDIYSQENINYTFLQPPITCSLIRSGLSNESESRFSIFALYIDARRKWHALLIHSQFLWYAHVDL